jgi:hypothetical protein
MRSPSLSATHRSSRNVTPSDDDAMQSMAPDQHVGAFAIVTCPGWGGLLGRSGECTGKITLPE